MLLELLLNFCHVTLTWRCNPAHALVHAAAELDRYDGIKEEEEGEEEGGQEEGRREQRI